LYYTASGITTLKQVSDIAQSSSYFFTCFDVLLTVQLIIFLVIKQLNLLTPS